MRKQTFNIGSYIFLSADIFPSADKLALIFNSCARPWIERQHLLSRYYSSHRRLTFTLADRPATRFGSCTTLH